MALLRVNACGDNPQPHGGPEGPSLDSLLRTALERPGPVVLMLHGYRYGPGRAGHCPHDLLYAMRPTGGSNRIVSWPRHLGFGVDQRQAGLGEAGLGQAGLGQAGLGQAGFAIAFGWDGRGTIRRAYREAARAGRAMAKLVRQIRAIDRSREVHVLAHSLGARVALCALQHLGPKDLSRLILMSAAEYRSTATAALATPAGQTAQVVHVTSRENDLYDCLLEWLVPAPRRGDRALGTISAANLRPVLLDDPAALAALARIGYRIAPPSRLICHWSPYLRPGVFALYRALLTGTLTPQALDHCLPVSEDRRWTRILPRRIGLPSLPFASKAPT
ncbi:alpha/beta hydrolase [Phaeobacter sp. J2-8]|uniref:alpha/beta hydrolase n=1 Tax=Phaeobacter sp. J2-8 TaxID=2931394 RepID=UPI001FD0D090|nr:alpha/beta hydrolase [Phaeobacter sp. J2-8]MCJ7872535.1 alpha/beta hydrolase [Phaeobacter sp. J2-8]